MRSCIHAALLALVLVIPAGALAATEAGQPFPTNLYTVQDATQITGLRVDLPTPSCSLRPSDCADIAVLNSLDGFNVQPRISIPFSGLIDTSTISSSTVFLAGPGGQVIGIDQASWEPAANTLHVESGQQLAQGTTYLLVVTTGVHAANGEPLEKADFRQDFNYGQRKDRETKAYRKSLLDALPMAMAGGANPSQIAAASVFTTQSIDATSRKIRSQLTAGPVSFNLGTLGQRTVFSLPVLFMQVTRQTGTATFSPPSFLPTPALGIYPGSVGTVAFGSYASPDYETALGVIPATGTLTGTPVPQTTKQIQFTLFVPPGAAPPGGWPTAIFGHGFTDSKDGAPWVVASSLGNAGIATIAINVVGHGRGALGSYKVQPLAAPAVILPNGGRGIDQNGNGTIDSTEGVNAVAPQTLLGNRDGLRQTVIDLMQLVNVIQGGMDVDGVPGAELSTSRIYYAGQSFGGIYGTQLLGLEPDIRAGVPNVPGGSIVEVARLGGFRPLVGISLITRAPSLYNAAPNPSFTSFIENMPRRNLPFLIDTVPGASAIQTLLDNSEWAQQAANPTAYAPFITRPVIVQFARGDKTVPNPTTSAILRAGQLASRATLFRNDLAYAANPLVDKNPHTFLTNVVGPGALYAILGQAQIGAFFASDGTVVIDPDGPGPFFETPSSMVPEDLAFIP